MKIPSNPLILYYGLNLGERNIHGSVSTLKEISQLPGNPDRFQVIFGKWKNLRKFKNMENICKHVEKYNFLWFEKATIF